MTLAARLSRADRTLSYTQEVAEHATPERRLWTAVLTRAIMDARGDGGPVETARARCWLILSDHREWRKIVCDFVGVDEGAVREKALAYGQLAPLTKLFPTYEPSMSVRECEQMIAQPVLDYIPRQGRKRRRE